MGGNFKKELTILAAMNQLRRRRATQRDAAEHERPDMITHLLPALLSLLSDKGNRMELVELVFADSRGEVACRKRSGGDLAWVNVGPDALPAQNLCDRFKRGAILPRRSVRFVIRDAS
jgi:hypothetical protein